MRAYLTDRNLRRGFVLLLFAGIVWYFRQLFVLFAFFVVFERTLAALAGYLSAATKLRFKWAVLLATLVWVGVLAGAVGEGVHLLVHHAPRIGQGVDAIRETILHSPLYARAQELGLHVSTEEALEHARHHAGEALHVVELVGRGLLFVVVALIFAVVFLLEREDVERWRAAMAADSIPRILLRYVNYVADAVAITLKLQVIVSLVNVAITVPVLLVLRLPGIPALIVMLLLMGLVPVVGGPIAGAVLMVLAYVTRGPLGLLAFCVSTFILHKIESYYLTPRLTAKHVNLPGFVLITSLVLFEHAFGIAGLFLSFPCLYVAAKIREEWVDPDEGPREDEETSRELRGELPPRPALALRRGKLPPGGQGSLPPTGA